MTPKDIREFQDRHEMSIAALARLTRKSQDSVYRWSKGEQDVDAASIALIKVYDAVMGLAKVINPK